MKIRSKNDDDDDGSVAKRGPNRLPASAIAKLQSWFGGTGFFGLWESGVETGDVWASGCFGCEGDGPDAGAVSPCVDHAHVGRFLTGEQL